MTVVSMSEREIGRLKVLARIEDGRLNVAAAAVELGLTRRQMHRILKAWRSDGAAGLVSKRRGLSSNRTLPVAWRELVDDQHRRHPGVLPRSRHSEITIGLADGHRGCRTIGGRNLDRLVTPERIG